MQPQLVDLRDNRVVAHPSARRVTLLALTVAAVIVAGLVASERLGDHVPSLSGGSPSIVARPRGGPHGGGIIPPKHRRIVGRAAQSSPNIVFVLTDDLSIDLLQYMPVVQEMQRNGLTFNDYFVSDSLCCPSRASIFSGNFPHDTHVFNNTGRMGGFNVFHERGEERNTFAVALQNAGYRTAMMGKYLNGYLQSASKGGDPNLPASYVPPGWDEWDAAGWGYPEFNYLLNDDGTVQLYGNSPADYLTDVMAHKGVDFINSSVASARPFFLELATFAPHSPYVPAPRDANLFPGLTYPELPNFDTLPVNPPRWLRPRQPLTPQQITNIDKVFRLRVQDVQAVDDMITQIEQTLRADGIANNTYIVFSSDNGIHAGEYRLLPGKETAFDTDIHVPLIVTGPGVAPGTSTNDVAENIDLAKTFAAIGGTTMTGDGQSLLPILHGAQIPNWRNAALIEHKGRRLLPGDPDFQGPASGDPPSYEAIRTRRYLYVEYVDGEREFYDLQDDPYELDNVYDLLTPQDQALLHQQLMAMENCHTGPTCWSAMHVSNSNPPY